MMIIEVEGIRYPQYQARRVHSENGDQYTEVTS